MSFQFKFSQRLGIHLPELDKDWSQYSINEQEEILYKWEEYRSNIPGRIKEIEHVLEQKQQQLNHEENFVRSCLLNDEISRLASSINDLNLWFRIQQETQTRIHR